MNRPQIISLKILFWIPTGAYFVFSTLYAWQTDDFLQGILANPGDLHCGIHMTSGFSALLNLGLALSIAGILGFAFLSHLQIPSATSIFTSILICLVCTCALLTFGNNFFPLLSKILWWLPPGI
jgi:hypothetical protein